MARDVKALLKSARRRGGLGGVGEDRPLAQEIAKFPRRWAVFRVEIVEERRDAIGGKSRVPQHVLDIGVARKHPASNGLRTVNGILEPESTEYREGICPKGRVRGVQRRQR